MISGATSDQHMGQLKDCFIQAANTLTSFYKQSCNSFNLAYQQGKQDAYEEIFLWFLEQQSTSEFKNVSSTQFRDYMTQKIRTNAKGLPGHKSIFEMHAQQSFARSDGTKLTN